MRKYYDKLDDYTDTRPSKLMEFTKWIMPVVIFLAAMWVILGTCGHLEAL